MTIAEVLAERGATKLTDVDPAYAMIRPAILSGLIDYHDKGIPTGDFLHAVLSNDLFATMGRADDYNRDHLHPICLFVCNFMSRRCYGSPKAVEEWIRMHRERREEAARNIVDATAEG